MLDAYVKPIVTPYLEKLAPKISASGLTLNKVILAGLLFGLAGCFLVGMQTYAIGIILILTNRLLASTGNAMARAGEANDLSAFLAILGDFVVYAAFAFFFALAMPEHAMAASFLIFAYLVIGMTYWGYAFFAVKRGIYDEPAGGIVGTTEIVLFMILCCLYPPGFSAFAVLFALLCWATAAMQIYSSIKMMRN